MARKHVVVHPRPDVDAVACVALSGASRDEVHYLPADAKYVPSVCPCCNKRLPPDTRVLDHPAGEKGRLAADGKRHAACAGMPEAKDADPRVIAEAEEQDLTGTATPRFTLREIMAAVRREAQGQGLDDREMDMLVMGVMVRIIRGLNENHALNERSAKQAAEVPIVEVTGFKVAILPPGPVSSIMGKYLNERGVAVGIYHDGHSLGISRYPGHAAPDLRKLEPFLPEWFVHTAGFLACWGSRKAPKQAPPPAGTPQTQKELLALLRKAFGD